MEFQRAIVVGASSGIGLEIAKQLLAAGVKVAGVARRLNRLEEVPGLIPFRHDVTDFDQASTLFSTIVEQLGGLDLIVYASGVMPEVALDEYDFAKDRQIVEVNLLGCMAWIDQAAAYFAKAGRGSMVAIGSVAGDRGRAGRPAYNASKAAVATYMEAIRGRFAETRVAVVTIKPGPTRTDMNPHGNLKSADKPEDVARFLLAHAHRSGEFYVRLSHRIVFAVIRMAPEWLLRKLPR